MRVARSRSFKARRAHERGRLGARAGGAPRDRRIFLRAMAMSYHERVARAMKRTFSAGSMNSYETILAALKTKYPTEGALRLAVIGIESRLKAMGVMPLDMKFPDDVPDA